MYFKTPFPLWWGATGATIGATVAALPDASTGGRLLLQLVPGTLEAAAHAAPRRVGPPSARHERSELKRAAFIERKKASGGKAVREGCVVECLVTAVRACHLDLRVGPVRFFVGRWGVARAGGRSRRLGHVGLER